VAPVAVDAPCEAYRRSRERIPKMLCLIRLPSVHAGCRPCSKPNTRQAPQIATEEACVCPKSARSS
jgi:hypothetical protein